MKGQRRFYLLDCYWCCSGVCFNNERIVCYYGLKAAVCGIFYANAVHCTGVSVSIGENLQTGGMSNQSLF